MEDKTGRSHPLILLLVFTQITGLRSTVPEPCLLNNIPEGTIATMCTSTSAVEEPTSGTFINDRVVLRIITHQDHCICQLTLLNQTEDETLYLRKHHGSTNAAPINDYCGLAVDIHHIPTGNHKAIDPIQCTKPHSTTKITLVINGMLQFESRKINGTFDKGYCMEILTVHDSFSQNPTISITCLEPDSSEVTSELPTTKGSNQVSDTFNATSAPTNLIPTQLASTTPLVTGFEQDTENAQSQPDSKEIDPTVYIAISACSSTVAILLLVVLVVTCIRNKSRQHVNRTNENADNTSQMERSRHYCDLTNNVLNMSGQEYDIIDSNYNTIDVDRS